MVQHMQFFFGDLQHMQFVALSVSPIEASSSSPGSQSRNPIPRFSLSLVSRSHLLGSMKQLGSLPSALLWLSPSVLHPCAAAQPAPSGGR
jgi:hypothetical protein